jgi:antitoxin component HigA of HigAB toxin-antitoxin module
MANTALKSSDTSYFIPPKMKSNKAVLIFQNEAQYAKALVDVEKYFDNEPLAGSKDMNDFDRLFFAIEAYEEMHYKI